MKFIPYDNFYIVTKLSPDETREKLQKVLAATSSGKIRLGGGYISDAIFFGFLLNSKFRITPLLSYVNSFSPIIKGTIEESPEKGSYIHITMSLSETIMVISGIIFLSTFLGFVTMVSIGLTKGHIEATIMIPICIFLFTYLFCMYGFWSERNNSVSTLVDLFEGE
jgi:hypothetical protein